MKAVQLAKEIERKPNLYSDAHTCHILAQAVIDAEKDYLETLELCTKGEDCKLLGCFRAKEWRSKYADDKKEEEK